MYLWWRRRRGGGGEGGEASEGECGGDYGTGGGGGRSEGEVEDGRSVKMMKVAETGQWWRWIREDRWRWRSGDE